MVGRLGIGFGRCLLFRRPGDGDPVEMCLLRRRPVLLLVGAAFRTILNLTILQRFGSLAQFGLFPASEGFLKVVILCAVALVVIGLAGSLN